MKKHVEEMNLWSVPVYAVPAIMEALQKEAMEKLHAFEFEEALSALYALQDMKKTYDEKVQEIERLNAPDPEPEEDGDENE